ncbi:MULTISPECIES: YfiT family bacillithiol transferase [Mammaliicoccus]|uniref:Metal-dependent hydrolase homologue n=1 Tax=Mammaliicoccus fleurettii TaxID=150056 RepID=D9N374_9STAP|nr:MULTISPECIES: putative metal-dependent hydrolase [Mammaliicoccus]MBO3061406.1 putative metal-dependent hydrolase [Mammaliicoccus fleurettii]MDT3994985.1 putative metal-dependent hydrolase [Mammaliicoccus fleurettii]MEB7724237.1 putative metal-dependent hydrolase [Mammaliicoccus fleurettii]MEB7779975.1 putative metal-dependent hydrolase [Mammaliicoccus fleurettii]MEB7805880.1 putative metal-dependent hydrolase [Mammaliicoccus fleurettii]
MDARFPIGELELPEKVTMDHIQQWLDEIGNYSNRLRKVVDGLDSEELNKTYREGSWTVRQLVHHIADSQLNMYQRLKIALTDDRIPTIVAFDQEEWIKLPDNDLPIECSLRMLEGMNERIVAVGRKLTEDQLYRAFLHEDTGETTVAYKIAKLSFHEEHHLAHIKLALSK